MKICSRVKAGKQKEYVLNPSLLTLLWKSAICYVTVSGIIHSSDRKLQAYSKDAAKSKAYSSTQISARLCCYSFGVTPKARDMLVGHRKHIVDSTGHFRWAIDCSERLRLVTLLTRRALRLTIDRIRSCVSTIPYLEQGLYRGLSQRFLYFRVHKVQSTLSRNLQYRQRELKLESIRYTKVAFVLKTSMFKCSI